MKKVLRFLPLIFAVSCFALFFAPAFVLGAEHKMFSEFLPTIYNNIFGGKRYVDCSTYPATFQFFYGNGTYLVDFSKMSPAIGKVFFIVFILSIGCCIASGIILNKTNNDKSKLSKTGNILLITSAFLGIVSLILFIVLQNKMEHRVDWNLPMLWSSSYSSSLAYGVCFFLIIAYIFADAAVYFDFYRYSSSKK